MKQRPSAKEPRTGGVPHLILLVFSTPFPGKWATGLLKVLERGLLRGIAGPDDSDE